MRKGQINNTVLITGATDGVGFLLAKKYADKGHFVLATGRKAIENDVEYFGNPNIFYLQADQSQPKEAATRIAATMRDIGWTHLNLAVLNAAIGWSGDPSLETSEEIDRQITINMTAPILISQALGPWLAVQQGTLALIGSTAAKGQSQFATYAATKAGLDSFARSLREEWRNKAHVVMVHPGPIRTHMHQKAGLKLGMIRRLFMSPQLAVRAIQYSIRKKDKHRSINYFFAWRSLLSQAQEGKL